VTGRPCALAFVVAEVSLVAGCADFGCGGIPEEEVLSSAESAEVRTELPEAVEARDRLRQWAPVVFVYLLWISVFTVAQMLLTNTVEEKSNRIIEVLLSSSSPVELMAGKIAGIAITGLAIVGSWMLMFFVGTKFLPGLLGAPPSIDLSALSSDPDVWFDFQTRSPLEYLDSLALGEATPSTIDPWRTSHTFRAIHVGWVRKSDLPLLLDRITDDTPAFSLMLASCSMFPNTTMTLGDHAAYLIQGYRAELLGSGYGGYPPSLSTDFAGDRDEIAAWARRHLSE